MSCLKADVLNPGRSGFSTVAASPLRTARSTWEGGITFFFGRPCAEMASPKFPVNQGQNAVVHSCLKGRGNNKYIYIIINKDLTEAKPWCAYAGVEAAGEVRRRWSSLR